MTAEQEKIQSLIDTGTEANIRLAFSLIEATGIEPELPTESDLQSYFASGISGGFKAIEMVETFYAGGYKIPEKRIFLCRQMLLNLSYWKDLRVKLGPSGLIPDYVRWMKQLTELIIVVHSIPADFLFLPDWLADLKNLHTLSFVGDFKFAEEAYQKITKIATLNFRENQRLSMFPDTNTVFPALKNLSLAFADIGILDLDKTPNLMEINCTNSTIKKVQITEKNILERPEIQSIIKKINSEN